MALRALVASLFILAALTTAIWLHEDVRTFIYQLSMTLPDSSQGATRCAGKDMIVRFRVIVSGDPAPRNAGVLPVRLPNAGEGETPPFPVMLASRESVVVEAKAEPAAPTDCTVGCDWTPVHWFIAGAPQADEDTVTQLLLTGQNQGDPPDARIGVLVAVTPSALPPTPDSRNVPALIDRARQISLDFRVLVVAGFAIAAIVVFRKPKADKS